MSMIGDSINIIRKESTIKRNKKQMLYFDNILESILGETGKITQGTLWFDNQSNFEETNKYNHNSSCNNNRDLSLDHITLTPSSSVPNNLNHRAKHAVSPEIYLPDKKIKKQ